MHFGPQTVEEHNRQYRPHIRAYASGQYLSTLAYYLAEKAKCHAMPTKILALSEDGRLSSYIIKTFPTKPGMYAYLLLPENPKQKEVKVIFRGTDFDEPESAAINFEFMGPGAGSFEQIKGQLFSFLKNNIDSHFAQEDKANLTLQVCGHSQGAALSQLFSAEFLRYRYHTAHFDSITDLHMTALNSPGVPNHVAKQANIRAAALYFSKKPLNIVANYGMVGGDPVQTFGMNTIFAKLPDYIAKVNLLKMDVGLEGSWLKGIYLKDGLQYHEIWDTIKNAAASFLGAHPTHNFYTSVDNYGGIRVPSKYQFYTNENAQDLPHLQGELLNKARLTQYLGIPVQLFIYIVYKYKSLEKWFCSDSMIKRTCNKIYNGLSGFFSRRSQKLQYELNVVGVLSQTVVQTPVAFASKAYFPSQSKSLKAKTTEVTATPAQAGKQMVCFPKA